MLGVLICEKYGWTWEEYENQPAFFIERIVAKMMAESEIAKREAIKQRNAKIMK